MTPSTATNVSSTSPFDPVIREQVRTWTEARRRRPTPQGVVPEDVNPREQYQELMLAAAVAQQNALLSLRASGTYNSRVLSRAQSMIDSELARFQDPEG
ncbi:hypothetical protein [Streptomyces sp. NPDC048243]|uniref:hypothetical protein n=1 Tax=Streptomyces sp. NPDC048243 TaxID=3365522 RepID=UPI0037102789